MHQQLSKGLIFLNVLACRKVLGFRLSSSVFSWLVTTCNITYIVCYSDFSKLRHTPLSWLMDMRHCIDGSVVV